MAVKPLDVHFRVPLQDDGWVQVTVRVDDIAVLSDRDKAVLPEVVDRVCALARELLGWAEVKEQR